jgi:hypothetical protein
MSCQRPGIVPGPVNLAGHAYLGEFFDPPNWLILFPEMDDTRTLDG